jgi:hypothetical protein
MSSYFLKGKASKWKGNTLICLPGNLKDKYGEGKANKNKRGKNCQIKGSLRGITML